MLIAERTLPLVPRHRRSPGFTLGEAARIRRDVLANKAELECPRCSGDLQVVGARGEEDIIWITTCCDCKLSLVVHRRAGDLA